MAFNPILQSQVSVEQPVEQPSLLGAVADAASSVLRISQRGGGSSGDSTESQLNSALVDGLMQAQRMREQGDPDGARAMERNVRINFARQGGNFASEATQDLVTSVTGMPAQNTGFSQEEVSFQEALESPEFQSAFLATKALNQDLSDQEATNMAFSRMARAEANETIVQETLFEWNTNQGQSSRISKINEWRENALGEYSTQTVFPEQ